MLSNSQLNSKWRRKVAQLSPDGCETRKLNLLWLIIGMYKAKSVHISLIARTIPVRAQKLSLDKRLRRFLSNGAIRVREWYQPVADDLLQAASSAGQVHLIIDSSKVGFGHQLLMVAIAYRRRALPLAWTWVKGSRGHSTTHKQTALLSYVQSLIPAGVKVSLVGDCEFGRATLLPTLERWGWSYALRQPSDHLILPQGCALWQRIDLVPLSPGDLLPLGKVALTYAHAVSTNLVLFWQHDKAEPWFLATNLQCPRAALLLYRRRMWIEEMFGDMKKHGFDLEASYLRHFLRLSRLTLAVCLLYLWLVGLGDYVLTHGLQSVVDRSDRRDLSIFRLGWDFLERRLALDDPLPDIFVPNFCSVSGG